MFSSEQIFEISGNFSQLEMENKLMTLDRLIDRLQEIREDVGHDCNVRVCMPRGSRVVNAKIEMVCSDYRDGEDCAYIEMGYDELKWFER